MEVYADDMVKSHKAKHHLTNMEETFEVLKISHEIEHHQMHFRGLLGKIHRLYGLSTRNIGKPIKNQSHC
jgi:hypothetical protein